MTFLKPGHIYFTTVFLTGAAVLIFEVAAVRFLAPYFGASLYVLSSVLTVILAALSLGYYLGGRLADRMPHFLPLYFIIGSAGVLMLFLLLAAEYVTPVAAPILSIVSGPLILSISFFFIPAFMLGIDSPFVIRILTEKSTGHKEHGATVGSVFFWSTVGSIVGSLAAGFYLIPTLGLQMTVIVTAIALVGWSSVAILLLQKIETAAAFSSPFPTFQAVYFIAGILMISGFLTYQLLTVSVIQQTNTKTLYESDGYYSHIHIFERTNNGTTYRFLKRDTNNSSAIIPGQDILVYTYAQTIALADRIVPEAESFLMLGGGAYTIPRHMHLTHPDLEIDVVEIEPELYMLAQNYFELPITEKITNHQEDARVFLQAATSTYDIIFSDIMNSGHFIPPHVSTVEFYRSMKQRLSTDGVGIINLIGALHTPEKNLTDALINTIAEVFPNHRMIAMYDPNSKELQNIIVFVRHESESIDIEDQTIINYLTGKTAQTADLLLDDYEPHPGSPLLFDDKNPTEQLLTKQVRAHKR